MAGKAFDYKKEFKELYKPGTEPVFVEVPPINYITVAGSGSPQGEEYQKAIEALYGLSYTIKMSKMSGRQPADDLEYVVPPLDTFWLIGNSETDMTDKDNWRWIAALRQPEFVDEKVFDWAAGEIIRKKTKLDASRTKLVTITEGSCVQITHIGPFAEEHRSMARIDEFIKDSGLIKDLSDQRLHHEIYMGDPRKTAPEKWCTILRIPVKK